LAEPLNQEALWLGPGDLQLPGNIVRATNEIVRLPGVDRVVLLPDVHLKEKYVRAGYKATVPSSAVIVSDPDALYPQFRSRGLGCGMMIVGTGLQLDGSESETRRVLRALPAYWSNSALGRPGLPRGTRNTFVMSADDMLQMSARGAPWVAEQFGLSHEALGGFFRGGSFLTEHELAGLSPDDLSPEWVAGRRRDGGQLGLDLDGNHFLEAQVVQDVPQGLPDRSLEPGELVFLYHGACNGLASLLRSELVPDLVERRRYASFRQDSPEYDLVLRAVRLLLNWSAASRCLVLARLRRLLSRCFPGLEPERLRCVSEAPHNSILVEADDDGRRIVYRHNAVPMDPGHPTIVSGRNDHLSYLILAGPAAERSWRTLDHGVGAILARRPGSEYRRTPLSSRRSERQYLRRWPLWHRHSRCGLIDASDTEPLFRRPYVDAGLAEPQCYRLRPLATLKRRGVPLRRMLGFGGVKR